MNLDLPVGPYIPKIVQTLKESKNRFLVLTAETGAGKSTVIPPGILEYFPGKILMTEPRRIAALSVAERISEILGEPCGNTCGYKIHLENKTCNQTRIEVVTEAVLSRTLQSDPSLDGYSVILLDEFHERNLTTDLNLAFLREAMELRDDLYVVIMSATIETGPLVEYLGENSVLKIPGRTFPVEVLYKPGISVTRAIFEELSESAKTGACGQVILAFLPGIKEIRQTEEELFEIKRNFDGPDFEIHVLHSSVSISDQKKIFEPLPEGLNRVIISSAIAETSLTVPGVSTVIDSGLSRVNRMNIALGMDTLVTETESEFSAQQRAGRAGRTQSGRCVRLWNKNEPRQKTMEPEILRSDISSLVLECAAWGKDLSIAQSFFLDSPSSAGVKAASEFLYNMDFHSKNQKITFRGRQALETGVSPRLANLILYAAVHQEFTRETVDLILKYSNYAESKPAIQKRFCDDILGKIEWARKKDLNLDQKKLISSGSRAALLFAGFSDRIAKKQSESYAKSFRVSYQFPNGHTAVLSQNITWGQAPEWLIAPEVLATNSGGTIFNYEALTAEEAETLIKPFLENQTECTFNSDRTKINKVEKTRYGKIVLTEKRMPISAEDSALAWCTEIRRNGLRSLNPSKKLEDFLIRAQFYQEHAHKMDGKIDYTGPKSQSLSSSVEFSSVVSSLKASPEEWLVPFLSDGNLTQDVLFNAIHWFLDGPAIDENVPSQIILPNGKKTRVTYELNSSSQDKTRLVIRPVIEIIIQRIFGCMESPKIMGEPVLLKLLSPAGRPLQITSDLEGFWNGTWVEICKEMKGRYPKHNWDYRIAEKE